MVLLLFNMLQAPSVCSKPLVCLQHLIYFILDFSLQNTKKKKKSSSSEGDDSEDDYVPPPRPKEGGRARKPMKYSFGTSDEEDDD